jgi:hypothetical protein
MNSKTDRKEAVKAFKARKVARGVFAVRCTATGRVWVDSSPNLDASRNGVWFSLRHGGYFNRSLQAEWNAHGADAFQFEVLESLHDDVAPLAVKDLLKEKKREWVQRLGAQPMN